MLDLTESPSAKLLDALEGDALLDRIVKYRALSLGDVLLKLELWRRLPADLWNSARVIESVTVDIEELRHLDAIRASGTWPTTTPPVHGGSALMRLVSPVARRLIKWRAHVMERRTLAMLDDYMLKDIGLTRMDVEREVSKPFWRQ